MSLDPTGFLTQFLSQLLATGVGVFLGYVLARKQDRQRADAETQSQRRAFALALISEIEAVRERYDEAWGRLLDATPEGSFASYLQLAIQEHYFSVFDANADRLGLLDPSDARKVIALYVSGKGHVDSFRTWAEMSNDVSAPARLLNAEYVARLKADKARLLEQIEEATRALQKYVRCKSG